MLKIITEIWNYLKDWRNLFSHTVVGILILAIGLFLPVLPVYQVAILLLIVSLNILRMRMSKRKAQVLE